MTKMPFVLSASKKAADNRRLLQPVAPGQRFETIAEIPCLQSTLRAHFAPSRLHPTGVILDASDLLPSKTAGRGKQIAAKQTTGHTSRTGHTPNPTPTKIVNESLLDTHHRLRQLAGAAEQLVTHTSRIDYALANIMSDSLADTHPRLQDLAMQHAQSLWPPNLPWNLPSYRSLNAPGRCLLCWTHWSCLGVPDVHPYNSTHGMDTNPDPAIEPGVGPSPSSHWGRGPEKLCVVCWSTPEGCELCRSVAPPSHRTFVEQRRHARATWNGKHMDKEAWDRCETWLMSFEEEKLVDAVECAP